MNPTTAAGAVSGGWEYVSAAYALTWLTFLAYTASLLLRARKGE